MLDSAGVCADFDRSTQLPIDDAAGKYAASTSCRHVNPRHCRYVNGPYNDELVRRFRTSVSLAFRDAIQAVYRREGDAKEALFIPSASFKVVPIIHLPTILICKCELRNKCFLIRLLSIRTLCVLKSRWHSPQQQLLRMLHRTIRRRKSQASCHQSGTATASTPRPTVVSSWSRTLVVGIRSQGPLPHSPLAASASMRNMHSTYVNVE